MATVDWSECPLVEVIPGKVSGAPLLKNTRLPVEAITGNYDAFRDEGLSPDAALAETLNWYPEAGIEAIKDYSRPPRHASISGAALKLFLDEDVPHKLVPFLPGHDIHTVVSMQWGGIKNGALLKLIEQERLRRF